MKLTNMVPMLNVNDIEASLDFYRKARDYERVSPKDLVGEGHWATIHCGYTELVLLEADLPADRTSHSRNSQKPLQSLR